ncbi:myosin heavy chain-related [Raphanus sativus]|nr:myosin heavy chain-related [Raphanus sativus]
MAAAKLVVALLLIALVFTTTTTTTTTVFSIDEPETIDADGSSKIQLDQLNAKIIEEILRTKHEATSKSLRRRLRNSLRLMVRGFPLGLPFTGLAYTEIHWEAHGKPALDTVILKVAEAKTQAVKWAEPHVQNVKTKYIPAITETVATHVEPHVRTLSIKAKEAYQMHPRQLFPLPLSRFKNL